MSYKIVVDSCCDLPVEKRRDPHFQVVPLTLIVDGHHIIDDETFDQADFLRRVRESPNCPRSSCPSPESYRNAYQGADDIYVVTLSGNLSGSYNSAVQGKLLYEEDNGSKNIFIVDSCSASSGEVQIALLAQELAESGLEFEQVCKRLTEYRLGMHTYFVLETLDSLQKNGRLSKVQACVANALGIKPVMGANQEGEILKLDQVRGINNAIMRMTDYVARELLDPGTRRVVVAHCNCPERAEFTRTQLLKRAAFREVMVVPTAGVSSLYACDGGVVIAG